MVILTSRLTQHNYTQTHQPITNETYKDISRTENKWTRAGEIWLPQPHPHFSTPWLLYLQINFIFDVSSCYFFFFFFCLLTLYWPPLVFLCLNARLLVINAQLVIKFSGLFSFLYLLDISKLSHGTTFLHFLKLSSLNHLFDSSSLGSLSIYFTINSPLSYPSFQSSKCTNFAKWSTMIVCFS